MRFDVEVVIFLAVVVADFFAGLDDSGGEEKNPVSFCADLCVAFAAVVCVTGSVFTHGSDDGFSVSNLKEIATANLLRLLVRHEVTKIFDNESALWNFFFCKQSESVQASSDTKGETWWAGC